MEDIRTSTIVLDDLETLKSVSADASPEELTELLLAYERIASDVQVRVRTITDAIEKREADALLEEVQLLLSNPKTVGDLLVDPSYAEDSTRAVYQKSAPRYLQYAPYSPSFLHGQKNIQRITTLPRVETSVLLQYDGDSMFTLHIPRAPEETNSVRVLSFAFRSTDDVMEFASLLGSELQVPGTRNGALGKNVQSGDGFDAFDVSVPLALDVVLAGGKQEFRLPEVVWNKFGGFAVAA